MAMADEEPDWPGIVPDPHARFLAAISAPKGGPVVSLVPVSNGPLLRRAEDWLAEQDPVDWIVQGILQRGTLVSCTAPTNHGKTAITLHMALCVAAGRRFAEREVCAGTVVMLCGENPDGVKHRMRATMRAMNIDAEDIAGRFFVLPQAMALLGIVQNLQNEITAIGSVDLVLVDTTVAFFSGIDENDNIAMLEHARALRNLINVPGRPCVLTNSHPPKNADRDNNIPRGGSGFLNEIDTNLSVWADGDRGAELHWLRKKRGPDFDPIPMEFFGTDIDVAGVRVQTVYALPISDAREKEIREQRMQDESRVLWAMYHNTDGSIADWARDSGWITHGMPAKSRVHRVLKRLQMDKLVTMTRKGYVLTKAGLEEAAKVQ